MMSELNEGAIECIWGELYEEAFDYLLWAEKLFSPSIGAPYKITIFYNLAYLYQKIGQLNDCNKYLT